MDTPDELIDLGGIAELLGLSPTTPQQWRQRGQLPPPDEPKFADKPLWRRSTIEKWAQDTGRWPPGAVARPPRSEQKPRKQNAA